MNLDGIPTRINAKTDYPEFVSVTNLLWGLYGWKERSYLEKHQFICVWFSKHARRGVNMDHFRELSHERKLEIIANAYDEYQHLETIKVDSCHGCAKHRKGEVVGCLGLKCTCPMEPIHTVHRVINKYNDNVLQYGCICIKNFDKDMTAFKKRRLEEGNPIPPPLPVPAPEPSESSIRTDERWSHSDESIPAPPAAAAAPPPAPTIVINIINNFYGCHFEGSTIGIKRFAVGTFSSRIGDPGTFSSRIGDPGTFSSRTFGLEDDDDTPDYIRPKRARKE